MLLITILILLFIANPLIAQYSNNFAYEWKTPADCAENEAYNAIVFKCKSCGTDQISNQKRGNCVCKPAFRTQVDKSQNQCVQCSQGFQT
jgi:hypothetical protein